MTKEKNPFSEATYIETKDYDHSQEKPKKGMQQPPNNLNK